MNSAWLVLVVGSVFTFFVGAASQILAYVAFGLCTDSDMATCAPGTVPTTWEWTLATVPTYLLWIAPSVIAAVLGYRAVQAGYRAGRVVMIVSIVAAGLITMACAAMWWL